MAEVKNVQSDNKRKKRHKEKKNYIKLTKLVVDV